MAIGNYYPVTRSITDDDLFLGTRAGNNNTVNYMAQTVVDYLNTNAKISIGGQLSFKFTIIPSVPKTIAFNGGGGDNTAFSAITQLVVSAIDASDSNVTVFLNYLDGNEILLSQQNEPNMFGHYKITSYNVIGTSQFYTLNLQFIGGNGNIEKDIYYDLNPFALSSNIGVTPTLQQVTAAGNTTSNNIIVNNGAGSLVTISNNGIFFESLVSHGAIFTTSGFSLVDDLTTKQFGLDFNGLYLKTISAGAGGSIKADLLTSTQRTYQLPNASGTLALTSDIPVITTPTLNQVLTSGNASLLDAKVGDLYLYDPTEFDYGYLSLNDSDFSFSDVFGQAIAMNRSGVTFAGLIGGFYGSIILPSVTNNRTYTLPDASGTIALTSDIPTAVTSVGATSPITSSGGTTPTISTSMSTNKLIGRSTAGTGVMEEITVGTGLTLSAGTLSATTVGGTIPHATASGTDTYTATVTGITSYADGDAYLIRFTNGNTTGCTLNINGLGAIPLYRNNDGAVIGGDIWAGSEMLCVYNSTSNVFQCIGTSSNSLFAYITNADTVAITKGQPVYAFGGTGDRLTVKRASCTSDATSARTIGVVLSSSIGVNQKGIIIIEGLLDGLNILPTATWSDGDTVYLGTTAGSITNVKQYAPNHLVYLGTVTTASNGSSGRWYVKVQNGYELDELHNVQAQSPSLKDTLWYDSGVTPGQWKTASIPTILGYTPFNLPSLTSGSVIFSNGTTLAQDNANFFWDDANNRLGLGTNTPSTTLEVKNISSHQITLDGGGSGIEGIQSINGGYLASYNPTNYNYQYGPLTMNPAFNTITFGAFPLLYGNLTPGIIPVKNMLGMGDSSIYDDGNRVSIGPQNLVLGGGLPDASAKLDVQSTTQGFLPPRMTTTQRNAISSPATGLIVYDTTLLSLYQYNGTVWAAVGGGGGGSTPVKLTSQTLIAASWTLSGGYYTYAFSDVNIDTTCDVSVTPQNASYLTAYNAQVLPFVGVAAGVATFYSRFPPQDNMVVDIVITQTT